MKRYKDVIEGEEVELIDILGLRGEEIKGVLNVEEEIAKMKAEEVIEWAAESKDEELDAVYDFILERQSAAKQKLNEDTIEREWSIVGVNSSFSLAILKDDCAELQIQKGKAKLNIMLTSAQRKHLIERLTYDK